MYERELPPDIADFEETPLVERLRRMPWPEPGPEVRQRCLEAILHQRAELKEIERCDRHESTAGAPSALGRLRMIAGSGQPLTR